ncbi:hypothetical protein ACK39A_06225, partial [Aeromonas veronii]
MNEKSAIWCFHPVNLLHWFHQKRCVRHKKAPPKAGLDATLKKQKINNLSGIGSQELRQTDKKRDSFGCNASQLSLTGIVFIGFLHRILLRSCL